MASSALILSVNFTYSFDSSWDDGANLFENLGVQLALGDFVAVVGSNGSGKSTLLRLIVAGNAAKVPVVYVPQVLPFEVVGEVGASGGERRMMALRRALATPHALLLLDEPTNDLDGDAKAWLLAEMLGYPGTILVASHDPEILDVVHEIWEIKNRSLQKHPAGFVELVERIAADEFRLREELEHLGSEKRKQREREVLLRDRQEKRMRDGARRALRGGLPKILRGARKRQAQRTLARGEAQQERKDESLREEFTQLRHSLRRLSRFVWDEQSVEVARGKCVVRVDEFSLATQNSQQKWSFELFGGQKLLLRGPNGSGKSTLLNALAGRTAQVKFGGIVKSGVRVAVLDQRLGVPPPAGELLGHWFCERHGGPEAEARTLLGRLGFVQKEQLRLASALSGGERLRLELALALSSRPELLLLDEPTNHLDLESRRILHDFVDRYPGALILVTHDQRFADSLNFDQIVDLSLIKIA